MINTAAREETQITDKLARNKLKAAKAALTPLRAGRPKKHK